MPQPSREINSRYPIDLNARSHTICCTTVRQTTISGAKREVGAPKSGNADAAPATVSDELLSTMPLARVRREGATVAMTRKPVDLPWHVAFNARAGCPGGLQRGAFVCPSQPSGPTL